MQTQALASGSSAAIQVYGGNNLFYAAGTWSGQTLTLTYCPTSTGTFVAIGSGVALTADGSLLPCLAAGFVKATLSGSATITWGIAAAHFPQ